MLDSIGVIFFIVFLLLSKGYKNDPLNFFPKLIMYTVLIVGAVFPLLLVASSPLWLLAWPAEIVLLICISNSKTMQEYAKTCHEEKVNKWHEQLLKIGKDVASEEIEYFLRQSPVLKTDSSGKIDIQEVYDWLCRQRSIELGLIYIDNKDKFNEMLGVDVKSLPPVPFDRDTSRVNGQKTGREGGANYSADEFARDYILSKTGLQYLKNYYGSNTSRYFINRESDYYKKCVAYIKGKCGGKQSERVAYEKYIQCINEFEDERTRVLAESEKRLRERRRLF